MGEMQRTWARYVPIHAVAKRPAGGNEHEKWNAYPVRILRLSWSEVKRPDENPLSDTPDGAASHSRRRKKT